MRKGIPREAILGFLEETKEHVVFASEKIEQ